MRQRQRRTFARLLGSLVLVAGAGLTSVGASAAPAAGAPRPLGQIVPAPASVSAGGTAYTIAAATPIRVSGGSPEAQRIGDYLAGVLRPSTGYALPVTAAAGDDGIRLLLGADDDALGDEGYRLTSRGGSLTIAANEPAGLFHGVQTLRQLLPANVEKRTKQSGPWKVAGGTVTDFPRYAYRGAMIDVSRHFFTVDQVERYIDQLALYKINELHLHLSDDQGWRIAVDSWPRLAPYGGQTQVGGAKGGFYTKDDYKAILAHASSRYMEVVPEIDTPGHINAALASYAELNCNGVAPPLYTGTKVGFSSLCVPKDVTYRFFDDVVREIAALTPGRYVHIGGDEAQSTSKEDYETFMDRAQPVVGKYGKTVMAWHQIVEADPVEGAVAQYWGTLGNEAEVAAAARAGTRLVMSPANRAYLDMKYDAKSPLGTNWAGYVEVDKSYQWDPDTFVEGVPAEAVLGVEAPIWSETLSTSAQIEYMAFPRLQGIAEIGWSPASTHDWASYKVRLAQQGPRMAALGIAYYRSPLVPWV
ncbi:Beta-N-acetylhexosaminidase [Streptomyces hundungensis]|uniref:beta-N-acetylhexosaminidase n=1 Tax=Streptomyces hundungensis TaxID=1077946 RepID=A0A387HGW3_9ACTN|nr:beta-N-acetylhexosaminidase [Streptomyces hundungensis]AYG82719.1 Beta-N-acetylhexosaminidase [Streptomyces hundungensis]